MKKRMTAKMTILLVIFAWSLSPFMQALRRRRRPKVQVLPEPRPRERLGLQPVQEQPERGVRQVSAQRQSWASRQAWQQLR